MISVGNWDNEYIYKPMSKHSPDGDNLRILSDIDGNQINWVAAGSGGSGSFVLNAGQYRKYGSVVEPLPQGTQVLRGCGFESRCSVLRPA